MDKIEIRDNRIWVGPVRTYWWYSDKYFWEFFKKIHKDSRILDAGCGKGVLAGELLNRGYKEIILTDIDDFRVIEKSKNLPFKKCDFNFDRFPFDDNSFDAVTSTGVLEHLENPFYFVREIRRILKPGGKFLIIVHNTSNIISRLLFLKNGAIESYYATNGHISPLPDNIFDWMMKGFKEIGRFYDQRKALHCRYFKIRVTLPRTKFWSYRMCYLFEKK